MNKKINLFAAILSVATITVHSVASQNIAEYKTDSNKTVYTMDEVIDIALKNRTMQEVDLQVAKEKYKKNMTIGNLLPNVNVNSTYGYTLKKQRMYFDSSNKGPFSFPNADEGIEVGQTHNIQAGLQASMPLVAPALWKALSINETSINIAKEKARESKISLINEVKKAYLGLLLAQQVYDVFLKDYNQTELNYKEIKAKFERGLVAEYDMIRQETKLKGSLPNVINSKQSIALAKAQLNVLMDRDADLDIKVTGDLKDFEHIVYKYSLENTSKSFDSVDILKNNTTLKQLDLQIEMADKAVTSKKFAYLPNLSLSYMYNYVYSSNEFKLDNYKRWAPFSSINLQLSIPLFSSGNRYYDLKQSKIDLQTINMRRKTVENQLNMSLMNQRKVIGNACDVFIASKDALKTAEKGYEIAKVRYTSGTSSLLELNDAEISLLQAQLNYNQSIYQFMISSYDLDKMIGVER